MLEVRPVPNFGTGLSARMRRCSNFEAMQILPSKIQSWSVQNLNFKCPLHWRSEYYSVSTQWVIHEQNAPVNHFELWPVTTNQMPFQLGASNFISARVSPARFSSGVFKVYERFTQIWVHPLSSSFKFIGCSQWTPAMLISRPLDHLWRDHQKSPRWLYASTHSDHSNH